MAIDRWARGIREIREVRFAPTPKRIRVSQDGRPVADTTQALLVWNRWVVPDYALPTTAFDGEPPAEAVTLDEPELDGYVLLPFAAFDWAEEDEPILSHPHDPFARIDILRSTRHVRVELDGLLLAETDRPLALFETGLPPRWYLQMGDVDSSMLVPTDHRTTCAYKGHASYFSVARTGGENIAWVYRAPLREAEPIRDHVCFYAERTVTTVDGVRDPGFVPPPGVPPM